MKQCQEINYFLLEDQTFLKKIAKFTDKTDKYDETDIRIIEFNLKLSPEFTPIFIFL